MDVWFVFLPLFHDVVENFHKRGRLLLGEALLLEPLDKDEGVKVLALLRPRRRRVEGPPVREERRRRGTMHTATGPEGGEAVRLQRRRSQRL